MSTPRPVKSVPKSVPSKQTGPKDPATVKSASRASGALSMPVAAAWAIIGFALVGIGIAIYLTIVHYGKVPLACSTGGVVDCNAVTRSVYSSVGNTGIPITVPGMAWFVVSATVAGIAILAASGKVHAPAQLLTAQLVWGLFGVVFVLYLIYVEAAILHKLCEWCTGIHVLVILTFLVTLAAWQRAMAARYAESL
jgi:uncharacterized membrane protein